jgi:tetratricopeptide (TPR) repeat protein
MGGRARALKALGMAALVAGSLGSTPVAVACLSQRHGVSDMSRPPNASLLVLHYESYLLDHDLDRFRRDLSLRYTEATLARVLQEGDAQARQAAVLALGLVGGFEVTEVVARVLRDSDPIVRGLADNALWAIWFRADTPANNALLAEVRDLIAHQRLEQAVDLASVLISRAPKFAEAYNQRAIAEFFLGRFDDSAADCRRVLQLNPYHFGALSGLGQCYLQLNQRREALKIFRRALKIHPFSEGLRETVNALEAEES